ncbi:dihydroxy-acid dehydratase [Halanaerobium congolense]|jgi:dihydroxy-acid dehydratase|uniref:Dihydroxy-acid dehydratase n=1 Tax=Halanaerobium congolense TaxID=54121 RepID=A0A1G8RH55_9FIRM|nr:dihydroxy-acid dehydratase [Halanaerobium congolense]KXS48312.1 MAG: dihydroxy-acid dehydratase [Halanaerobium sp. T82-1]OEG63249.1 MAG: dihydroxy-acid dehydratase [Halanaerobium sp. MDAL1]PUU91045.1 MAG: dihydroxy-acid dehydratase [Halanaerobium sp.]PXV63652.1 dihydroxy-acid dehydratase [Halanaerobium congolense]SDJ16337.1 dihydroxy-acid dehydratase [Halanaerobium congolense]
MNNKFVGTDAIMRRAMLKGCGFDDADIKNKPHIGIVNTYNEGAPGHAHLNGIAESIKQGVWAAGGVPVEFGAPSTCGDMIVGEEELKYELAGRDVVAMGVEYVSTVHQFDGLVLLASCDNIIPGVMLGAIRVDVPSIVITGGSMLTGEYQGKEVLPSDVGVMTMGKNADSQKVRDIENIACMCPGACSTMGTANSMQIMTEVLGLNLPGTATIPAVYADKKRAARSAGKRIVSMVEEDLKPSALLNREIFLNAVKTNIAMGGSTNVILHLLALAREAKVELTIDDFAEFGNQIPCICGVKPSGSYSIVDFHKAGGVPALLKELELYLDLNVSTITGQTIGEIIAEAKNRNSEVIRSLDNPINGDGGLKILRGNLAPNSAIVRSSSVPESMKKFTGPAKVFNRDQEGVKAIKAGEIEPGDVMVIRYEGPKGAPGMKEIMLSTDALVAYGLDESVGLITDGRFSGFNHGPIIGHVTPEAYAGGPLALVENGDIISVDIKNSTLDVKLSEKELAARREKWKQPEAKVKQGMMHIYAQLCKSADQGAGMTI